jgi:hypothetical protein
MPCVWSVVGPISMLCDLPEVLQALSQVLSVNLNWRNDGNAQLCTTSGFTHKVYDLKLLWLFWGWMLLWISLRDIRRD